MEWFGITSFGIENSLKDMVRSDYVEPVRPQNLLKLEAAGKLRRPFYEMISQLDCYVGRVDGYAYKSNDRLLRMRKKAVFKPVGPLDMYKYPGCTSMDMGWWRSDPALTGQTWYLPKTNYPQPVSEKTKFVDHQLKIHKIFRF